MEEKIFRIRRYTGVKDGPNYYHHADIIETHHMKALAAARQGRVNNWRWIDTYDISSEDYEEFEYLYLVDDSEAKRASKPLEKIVG